MGIVFFVCPRKTHFHVGISPEEVRGQGQPLRGTPGADMGVQWVQSLLKGTSTGMGKLADMRI